MTPWFFSTAFAANWAKLLADNLWFPPTIICIIQATTFGWKVSQTHTSYLSKYFIGDCVRTKGPLPILLANTFYGLLIASSIRNGGANQLCGDWSRLRKPLSPTPKNKLAAWFSILWEIVTRYTQPASRGSSRESIHMSTLFHRVVPISYPTTRTTTTMTYSTSFIFIHPTTNCRRRSSYFRIYLWMIGSLTNGQPHMGRWWWW